MVSLVPAIRALRRNATTTVLATTSIGFALAANLVLFSLLWGQYSNPPYPNIDRLVQVWSVGSEPGLRWWNYPLPVEAARRLTSEARAFGDIALTQGHLVPLEAGGESRQGWIQEVTSNYYRVLGVRPWLGRFFTADDTMPGAQGVALLPFESWQARFGSDSGTLGRTIRVRGVPHEVVGIIPPGISAYDMVAHVPLRYDPANRDAREQHVAVTALLGTGRSLAEAQAEVRTIGERLRRDSIVPAGQRLAAGSPAWFARQSSGGPGRILLAFLPSIALLLAASLNVAGLLLARGLARQREYAVRLALGASRWDVARAALTEAGLLALLGLAAAAILSMWGLGTVLRRLPSTVDAGLGVVAAVLTTATILAAGLLPALRVARLDVQRVLRNQGSAATHGPAFRRVQGVLVIGQGVMAVTFATLLVAFAIRFARNAQQGLGFDPTSVLTFTLRNPGTDGASSRSFGSRARETVASAPGIIGASIYATRVLTVPNAIGFDDVSPALPVPTYGTAPRVTNIDGGYLEVLSIPVLRGRGVQPDELAADGQVALINERAAELWFGSLDPIGRRVRIDSFTAASGVQPWLTIVGVVRGIRDEPLFQRVPPPAIYTPAMLWNPEAFRVVVKSGINQAGASPVLRGAVAGLVDGAAPPRIESLHERLRREDRVSRDQAAVSGAATVFTVSLALLGLYGMVRIAVEQRRRELAVRAALGAAPLAILRLVLLDAARLVMVGMVLGGGSSMVVLRVTDLGRDLPVMFQGAMVAGACLGFLGCALLACLPVARRAAGSSPSVALRADG